ncbi:ABC transporter ATP-binding protein [Hypericibacter terrae]|jgi:branched-chain amino acid transport system permease protein|uniref:ABC transporter ATP-binding protein n=1 Tax=Hypericibacter terrae TaxID=2602015 RepID=A0A5J6MPA2_9PROT|nr:branched-chain amino acid ABC transporter permease [Hypericibacter terrae]QEX19037.1 ABC transporter ATP-binding protein [Hypericibacter terrae]
MASVTDTNQAPTSLPAQLAGKLRPHHLLVAAFLLVYPLIASDFWIVQIGAQTFFLGLIALSLTLLAGYGGMVSLAQLATAGVAAYMYAIFGQNSANLGLDWPWWVVIPLALAIAVLFATLVGALSVRTEGIYTIMITLAISVAFFYFCQQNYSIFNGFKGYAGIAPPHVFGVDWRAPVPFYFLALGLGAFGYFGVLWLSRSTFGIALQAVRDNPRRMAALGFNVRAHRIAAYAVAGLLAGLGGLLLVWYNGRISPGTIGVGGAINILVIAILGGLRRPIGPFIGALFFVLLDNFAIDLIDRERFNLVIGIAFLAVVLFSPDGVLGLWDGLKRRLAKTAAQRGKDMRTP